MNVFLFWLNEGCENMAVKENKKEESLKNENVKNTKKISKDNSKAKKNVAKPAKKESWFKGVVSEFKKVKKIIINRNDMCYIRYCWLWF